MLAVDDEEEAIAALAAAARHAQGLKPIETKVRDLFRIPLSPKELEGFDAVVLDPARSGAEAQARQLARSRVPVAICVSCNPGTLARDARILLDGGYVLESVTPIDQFLYSAPRGGGRRLQARAQLKWPHFCQPVLFLAEQHTNDGHAIEAEGLALLKRRSAILVGG